MTSDLDIYLSANLLVKQHGQGESKVCYLKCCQRTGGIDGTGDDHMP